jgi:hypothetical protein
MSLQEGWRAIDRAALPDFVALCERIEDRFLHAAAGIQLVLDGEGNDEITNRELSCTTRCATTPRFAAVRSYQAHTPLGYAP